MDNHKTALLLLNIGTPEKPTVKEVRKFLFRFLNDKHVIDLPWILRKLLVNLIIVPFRASRSTKLYKKLWDKNGSPLLYYSNEVVDNLQKKMDGNTDVYIGMRYGKPNIEDVLKEIYSVGYGKIVVLPQFPQYASSTTQSAVEKVIDITSKWSDVPEISTVWWFFDHPSFIHAFTERIKLYNPDNYDHIIFSYHSLPLRHIDKIHRESSKEICQCGKGQEEVNPFCYKSGCYETTRLISDRLNLSADKYSVAFQSRFSKNWLSPFTDETIKQLAADGKRKLLVVCPSFVTDCLETKVEIGMEYTGLFKSLGGDTLDLVESLNDMPEWIDALKDIAKNH